jgi:subtilisin family serine protease
VSQSYGSDALVVAATGPSGSLATYSQYGAGVTLAAPGGQPDSKDNCEISDCVLSLYPGNQLAVAAGTSMAAPHVSGLAALLFGQDPRRSRDAVISRIESTAHPLSGAGYGLIDVRAALGVPTTPPKPSPTRTVSRTSSPKPVAKPSPRPTATRATATPTRTAAATPTLTVTASPTPMPSFAPPTAVAQPPKRTSDDLPLPLLVVAGLLVLVAASAVISLGRR